MADPQVFRREYRHSVRYVEDSTEKSEAAWVYDMLLYKWQEEVQAEEQKRGRWTNVVKILLPQQQHTGLLQWINSLTTADYGLDTMKNTLMLSTENRRMGKSLKAMDKVWWTTGMLYVQAFDKAMIAAEIMDLIGKKMTLQHRKETQHEDGGGQRYWQLWDVEQTDAHMAKPAARSRPDKPEVSGSAAKASGGKPQSLYPEVGVQAVDAILAEVDGVQSAKQ